MITLNSARLGKVRHSMTPVAQRTDYRDFVSPLGVLGLAYEYANTVEILAVAATVEGSGQFRAFVQHLQRCCDDIYVWEVMEPRLHGVLTRYGFVQTDAMRRGERVTGYWWKAPARQVARPDV